MSGGSDPELLHVDFWYINSDLKCFVEGSSEKLLENRRIPLDTSVHINDSSSLGSTVPLENSEKVENFNNRSYHARGEIQCIFVEIAVLFCFFDDQLTNLSPKNYALPEVIMLNFEGWKLDGYQADGRSCVVLKMVLVGQMDSPPQSPNHVFNFPENEEEFEEDPQEDPEEEVEEWDDMDIIEEEEEDPEEDPEEWDDVDAAEQVDEIPHPVTPPRNPTAVPHSSPEQSSESEDNDLANPDEAQDVSPPKSTYEIGSTSNAHATVSAPMIITSVDEPVSQVEELSRNVHYCEGVRDQREGSKEKKLCEVEDKVEKKEKKRICPFETHGALRPRGIRRAAMERMIADRVAQAIEDHEKKRASSSNTEGSSSSGGCSHKTFMNVNMARELVEQSVQGKASRSGDDGKRKWDDNRRNTKETTQPRKRCHKKRTVGLECRWTTQEVESWGCGGKWTYQEQLSQRLECANNNTRGRRTSGGKDSAQDRRKL
ncbi:hypothetical protein Tco_1383802 [Tanacetum coccineum]